VSCSPLMITSEIDAGTAPLWCNSPSTITITP
jgi:hypothetical protein